MEFKWPQVEMNNCVETRFLCISKPSESAVAEALNHELQNELSNVRKMNVVLVFWQIWSSSSSTQLHHTVHLHWASTAMLFGFITEWKWNTKYIQQRVIIHTLFPHQTLEFSSTPFFLKTLPQDSGSTSIHSRCSAIFFLLSPRLSLSLTDFSLCPGEHRHLGHLAQSV